LADAVQRCRRQGSPGAGIEQRDGPGLVSGVASGRHAMVADQPGAGQRFRL